MPARIHRHFPVVAERCGVNASLIFFHITHWVIANSHHGKNFYDGRYWTYMTVEQLAREPFSYMTPNQIRYALQKLRDEGLIMTGNYNKTTYDRTLWYTLTPEGHRIIDEYPMDEENL